MAESFLEPIYKEARLLCILRQVVECAKCLDEQHAFIYYNEIAPELLELCKCYIEFDGTNGMELYRVAKSIAGESSLVCIGDKVEHELIPRLEEYMKHWGKIETDNDEGDYLFETTVSGFLTIKDVKENVYLHSTVDPMWEARKQVEYMYAPQKNSYSILGCGLGYFIYQLYLVSEGSVDINVYVRDQRMVDYARKYGVLDWIPQSHLNIIVYEDSYDFLLSANNESTGFHILPGVIDKEPEEMRVVLLDLYMECSTSKKFAKNLSINFYRNIQSDCKPVSSFDVSKLKEEFIVVAAGPSLDESMDFIRQNKGKKTVVAVGTVFKKLLAAQIEPDIVVVVDPQARTYKQIEGVEESQTPLLIAMSAFWKFAAAYKGEKYLVPVAQTMEMIQYSRSHELKIWECFGTVTSLAIETAIQFNAKSVYLVGVDLAYPNGVSHAEGTMDRCVKDVGRMQPVMGVNGQTVYSTEVFNVYRETIEKKIANTPHIVYYNMSRIGSRIVGTQEITEWKHSIEGVDE